MRQAHGLCVLLFDQCLFRLWQTSWPHMCACVLLTAEAASRGGSNLRAPQAKTSSAPSRSRPARAATGRFAAVMAGVHDSEDEEDVSRRDKDSSRAALAAKAQGALQTAASKAVKVGSFYLHVGSADIGRQGVVAGGQQGSGRLRDVSCRLALACRLLFLETLRLLHSWPVG